MEIIHSLLSERDDYYEVDSGGQLRIMFFSDTHLSHATPISRKDEYSQTMMQKLYDLATISLKLKCDLVIVGGDIWHTKTQPDVYVIDAIHAFNQFLAPVYTVVGNHDIYYSRTDTLPKTPMGLVLSSNVVKRLGRIRCKLGPTSEVVIQGYDYHRNPKFPEEPKWTVNNHLAVLVTHNYLFSPMGSLEPEDCFSEEEFEKSAWDIFLVGHDHSTLPVFEKGLKKIIRPGALSRGTKHVQNRLRDVCFCILDVFVDGRVEINQLPLRVKPTEEIFSDVQIDREDISKKMTEFVRSLATKASMEEAEIDVLLKQLCGDDTEVYNYVNAYIQDVGLTQGK